MTDDERRGFEWAVRLAKGLSMQEARIVWALTLAGQPVHQDDLIRTAWPDNRTANLNLLRVHLGRLREKLLPSGLILTKAWRKKYTLAPVDPTHPRNISRPEPSSCSASEAG